MSASLDRIAAQERASAPSMEHQQQVTKVLTKAQTQGTVQLREDEQDLGMTAYARDSYDQKAEIRRQVMHNEGAARILGIDQQARALNPSLVRTMPVTEEELSYAERVQAQEQQLQFDQWLETKFDLRDPANMKIFKERFPSHDARRKAHINAKFDIMRKWTDITADGLQNMDDAYFLFAVESGAITLPAGYESYEALTSDLRGGDSTDIAERGMFNLRRLVKDNFAGRKGGYPIDNPAFQRGKVNIGLGASIRNNARRGIRTVGDSVKLERGYSIGEKDV